MAQAYISQQLSNTSIPRISISIVVQGVSNADLSSIEPFTAAVSSVGDLDRMHFVSFPQVHSPPGAGVLFCVGTGVL